MEESVSRQRYVSTDSKAVLKVQYEVIGPHHYAKIETDLFFMGINTAQTHSIFPKST